MPKWEKIAEVISKFKAALVSNSLEKTWNAVTELLKKSPELRKDKGFVREILTRGIEKKVGDTSIRLKLGNHTGE